MASFTETSVSVSVHLEVYADGSKHVFIDGTSWDSAGAVPLRHFPLTEVTASLTATQQNEALDLVNAATAYIKSLWGIA